MQIVVLPPGVSLMLVDLGLTKSEIFFNSARPNLMFYFLEVKKRS